MAVAAIVGMGWYEGCIQMKRPILGHPGAKFVASGG